MFGASLSAILGKSASTTIKTPGTTTPAPAAKVLRWKDLEAAALTAAAARAEEMEMSGQSVFGTEEGRGDVLTGNELWNDEESDIEDLFL